MATRSVLVLGGGVGGVVAANELRRRLDPRDRVVMVDRESRHLFQPSLVWLMAGHRRPERISRPLRGLLAPEIDLVQAEVRAIDPVTHTVDTSAGALRFDALVLALGAELAPDAIEGFADAAHNIFSVPGASACARQLDGFRGGRVAVAVTTLPYKCPAAPYEAALVLDGELRRRGVRAATEIDLYTPEAQPMPVAGPVMGEAVTGLLEAKGIRFHPRTPIARFEPGSCELVLGDGSRAGYDLLAGVPPHRAPAALRGSGLTTEAGWVAVDPGTLQTAVENIYAVGDATSITLANGKPLPKAGVFAHAEALVAARRIALSFGAAAVPGTQFKGRGFCWVETGGAAAAFADGDFYARPDPSVVLRGPGRIWHGGKLLFERYWLADGLERATATVLLRGAARLLGVQAEL